ncbi:hypothetical protein D4F06_25615 [Salmonella enterica subsp. enterica serovar Muenchen]|nr:hypothetical protein [Salmonella enterica subsp. enterica serovar Muenchen]EBW7189844.1 hypothetical protein [Salmonella enterica subsp. enterica serovar Muenchen]EBX4463227.1 hypothetical protein [Salmonella enterica subsp. enterica serovar Muenchen]EBY3557632.1 hypothetical protein [Salmonella enterica subsp. enterica serovar Muenchen]EIW3592675.1 hypothetical protein [Salmonella enterica]
MNIHARYGNIKGMGISLLSTTNDIEQLRTLALAMVQKVVSENAEKEKLQQRIRLAHLTQGSQRSHAPQGLRRSQYLHPLSAITAVSTSAPAANTDSVLRRLTQYLL